MRVTEQRCLHHPAREAVARCPGCGNTFCRECVTEHDDRVLCADCLQAQASPTDGPRLRRVSLGTVVQLFCGVLVSWLFFYAIGQALLALPSSFHDGTVWQDKLLNRL